MISYANGLRKLLLAENRHHLHRKCKWSTMFLFVRELFPFAFVRLDEQEASALRWLLRLGNQGNKWLQVRHDNAS